MTIGNEEEEVKEKNDLYRKEKGDAGLLEFLRQTLNEHIEHIRLSTHLGASPACLAGADTGYGPQVGQLWQRGGAGRPKQRRVLELNPNHPIFFKMRARFERNEHDAVLSACAELLLGYALLAEGAELPDSSRFNRLLAGCILHAL
jgi:molecular chaperone HtpG